MVIIVPSAVPSGIKKEPVKVVSVPLSPTLYVSVGAGTSVSVLLLGFTAIADTVMVFPAISDVGVALLTDTAIVLVTV